MAIRVEHGPNLGVLGQAAYGAGQRQGQFQSGQQLASFLQNLQSMRLQRESGQRAQAALALQDLQQRQNYDIARANLMMQQQAAARAEAQARDQQMQNLIGAGVGAAGFFLSGGNPLFLLGTQGVFEGTRQVQRDRSLQASMQNLQPQLPTYGMYGGSF